MAAKARDAYLKATDLGPDPHTELREGNTPVGLKVWTIPESWCASVYLKS